ncbi:MAG: ATP-dependent DNA helicase [Bacteroidales bacterium]
MIPGFEPRPSQREMAVAVADAFEGRTHILVEAGTGTGKTLAYLVPAILSRQRVLVSTGTKNLQEQIYFKDLPVLADALGVRFTATYMKGRANYLCLQKLEPLKATGVSVRRDPFLAMLLDWAVETKTGDRAELADLPEDLPLWDEVSATSEGCLGSTCPHYADCFVTRMRQRAAESDVVIVNHHLLCADAAVRQNAYGEVIPACAYAVIDEAHQLEDVATQYFGVAVSTYRVEELCHDAEAAVVRGTGQGARRLDVKSEFDLGQALASLRDQARAFFMGVQFNRMAGTGRVAQGASEERAARLTSEFLAANAEAGHALLGALDVVEQSFAAIKDPSEEEAAIGRRAGEIRDDLRFLLRASDPDYVYYVELRGRGVFLRAAPIEVSRIIRAELLDRFQAVVLTSATLSVGGSFQYMRGRLGLGGCAELRLASEFDYASQAILYLPSRMPDPRSAAFAPAAAAEIVEILRRTCGRAFVLFTSYAMLRHVQPVVEQSLDYPILAQGQAPRSVLLEQFRGTPNAVLLATSSFWQGVDVVGEALSCVVVDKLPFASPADPVTAARMDAIARRGGEPFWEYEVPLAILTLQQGLGRLIRHRSDRGVLAILDPRLRTKSYGATFLEALPPAPVTTELDGIRRFLGVA